MARIIYVNYSYTYTLHLCTLPFYICRATLYSHTVVPPFNGPSDEWTPAMSGHYLDVRTVLPC